MTRCGTAPTHPRPAFGSTALKNYYGRIVEVADDLFAHLDRLGPDESFLATDLMTRMTFEAISYAAFNKRYGAIDSPDLRLLSRR